MDRQKLISILKEDSERVSQYNTTCLYNSDWVELLVSSNNPRLTLRTVLNVVKHTSGVKYIVMASIVRNPSLGQYANLIGLTSYSLTKHICSEHYKDSDIYDIHAIEEDDLAEILIVRPELAPICPWHKFWTSDFEYLLKRSPSFSDVIACEKECGSLKRNIYVCIYDIQHVRIGCFYDTEEDAIEAIECKYGHTSMRSIYINKVKQVFKKAEELANVKNI